MTTATSAKKWLPRLFQRSGSHADIISTHTDDLVGDTEFFASLEENSELAFFKRSEIETGEVILRGSFTVTREVVGIAVAALDRCTGGRRQDIQESVWIDGTDSHAPRYTIKQLSPETLQTQDPKVLSRAARELVNDAKYLSRLSHHPNIVSLRGVTRDAFGHNYLAHQFEDFFLLRDTTSTQTLQDKIYKEWRTDYEPNEDLIPMKANYAFQIAKALRFCHEEGVLYRDLKPTNIGFSSVDPHCVQLLEFGLARDIPKAEASFRMTLAGTRRYLAGEVLTSGEYTTKSDVYSWAMVYYEMCTERKPYHGLTATEHQTYVCKHGDRPCLDDYYLPEALDVILSQAWHPHLHKRWDFKEVCTAMQAFLMQLDVSYYSQKEGDFLFDIEPTPIAVESWTEEFGEPAEIVEEVDVPTGYYYMEQEAEEDDPAMKASEMTHGTASRRASLSSVEPVTPRRIISSAA